MFTCVIVALLVTMFDRDGTEMEALADPENKS